VPLRRSLNPNASHLSGPNLVTADSDFLYIFIVRNIRIGEPTNQGKNKMSERLTAPARSPLRRVEGKDSPLKGKSSKSPIRRLDTKTKSRPNGNMELLPETTEADSLRQQLAEADIDHDTCHLSPALQRFWQV
jgi:hypothetical protein